MDWQLQDGWPPRFETSDELLDLARAHPEWTDRQRAACLDLLVVKFAPEDLIGSARRRFSDLSGPDGELALRIAESMADDDLLRELAHALMSQPDLAAERVWDALTLFQGSSVLDEFPELADLCDELEAIAQDDSDIVDELAQQLESDPDGPHLAILGLDHVEPEIRAQIISELAQRTPSPGIVEFLRLLALVDEPLTQSAALEALLACPQLPHVVNAWQSLLDSHPDPHVQDAARQFLQLPTQTDAQDSPSASPNQASEPEPQLEPEPEPDLQPQLEPNPARDQNQDQDDDEDEDGDEDRDESFPSVLITSVNGEGQSYIAVRTKIWGKTATAAFECDVQQGLTRIWGELDPDQANRLFDSFLTQTELDVSPGPRAADLAKDLLAGSLMLSGPKSPDDWRFWTEKTFGEDFRPQPFLRPLDDSLLDADWSSKPSARQSQLILDSCPFWFDDSDLTYKLAEEIAIREKNHPMPDPGRDAPVYRYFFEKRLRGRVDLYRQMLGWMVWFWTSSGDLDLARAALAIARQLSDPQHALPQNPFMIALSTRSLTIAQHHLAAGVDLRLPRVRQVRQSQRWTPSSSSGAGLRLQRQRQGQGQGKGKGQPRL